MLGLSASSERVRPSAAELDERQLAPYMPMSTRRGRDSMHTQLIPPVSSEFGHPRTPRSPSPRSSDVAHLTGDQATKNRAGGSGNTRPLTHPRAVHARVSRLGRAEWRLQGTDPAILLPKHLHRNQVIIMIVLGIILIVLGLLLPSLVPTFAFAHIVLVIGVILLVVGLLMMLMGRRGHAVGGRRHYY